MTWHTFSNRPALQPVTLLDVQKAVDELRAREFRRKAWLRLRGISRERDERLARDLAKLTDYFWPPVLDARRRH